MGERLTFFFFVYFKLILNDGNRRETRSTLFFFVIIKLILNDLRDSIGNFFFGTLQINIKWPETPSAFFLLVYFKLILNDLRETLATFFFVYFKLILKTWSTFFFFIFLKLILKTLSTFFFFMVLKNQTQLSSLTGHRSDLISSFEPPKGWASLEPVELTVELVNRPIFLESNSS